MPRSQREIWQDRFSRAAILASIIAIILRPAGTSPGIFALVASAILFLQIIIELLAITTGLIVILALLLVFTLGFIAISGTLVYYVLRMSDPGVRD